MCRSLREQILCEKVSPPAAPRAQTDAGHALDVDHLKLSSTTRIWLMRLQRLECDYFVSGPDSAEAGADWMHGRAQHVRRALLMRGAAQACSERCRRERLLLSRLLMRPICSTSS